MLELLVLVAVVWIFEDWRRHRLDDEREQYPTPASLAQRPRRWWH